MTADARERCMYCGSVYCEGSYYSEHRWHNAIEKSPAAQATKPEHTCDGGCIQYPTPECRDWSAPADRPLSYTDWLKGEMRQQEETRVQGWAAVVYAQAYGDYRAEWERKHGK